MNITNVQLIDDLIYKHLHQSHMNNLNKEFKQILNVHLQQAIVANHYLFKIIHSYHERKLIQRSEENEYSISEKNEYCSISEKKFLYKNGFRTFEHLNDIIMFYIVQSHFISLFFMKSTKMGCFPFTVSSQMPIYFYYKIENGNIEEGEYSGRVGCYYSPFLP